MYPGPRGLTRDRQGLAAGQSNLVVRGHRKLQDHMRAAIADAAKMAGVIVGCFRREKTGVDCDPHGAQSGVALTRNFRVGIPDRSHHPRNPGGNDRVDARRRLAEMRARLERHIERGALRLTISAVQRHRLCMRTTARLGPAPPDNDAVLDHDRADGRVRPGAAESAPAERESKLHKATIGFLGRPMFLLKLILQDAEDHFRIVTILASSSPESSPSTVSKSLASRKLR